MKTKRPFSLWELIRHDLGMAWFNIRQRFTAPYGEYNHWLAAARFLHSAAARPYWHSDSHAEDGKAKGPFHIIGAVSRKPHTHAAFVTVLVEDVNANKFHFEVSCFSFDLKPGHPEPV